MNTQTFIPEQYRGILIRTHGEQNLYHDSYWNATIWDVNTNKPRVVLTATTAAGGDGMWFAESGITDLAPEIQNQYDEYCANRDEELRIQQEEAIARDAEKVNMTPEEWSKVVVAYPLPGNLIDKAGTNTEYDIDRIFDLLKVKKYRSAFRASIAAQIRDWVSQESPEHAKPLSLKQLNSIKSVRRSY